MQMPKGYKEAAAYTGDREQLPIGGHVCVILDAREEKTKTTHSPMLVISFDIAPNESYAGFYRRIYASSKANDIDAKWPNGGTFRQFTTNKAGTCNEWFKGMIENIEKSNPEYNFMDSGFDERTLKGKLFGGYFRREEYENRNGERKWSVHCFQVRTVDDVRKGLPDPEDVPLKGEDGPVTSQDQDFTEIAKDDDLPF